MILSINQAEAVFCGFGLLLYREDRGIMEKVNG